MIKFKAVALCLTLVCALTIPGHATIIIISNINDNGPRLIASSDRGCNDAHTTDATGMSGAITLTTRGGLLVKGHDDQKQITKGCRKI